MIGEYIGLITLMLIIAWQYYTEYRIKKELKKYKLKDVANALIEILQKIDESGILDGDEQIE